jgi:spore maturation protein CgeB
MKQVPWPAHWQILESRDWVKWVWETAHAEELMKMGIPNVIALPMAAADKEYDRSPLSTPSGGPAVAFMGHPASTWFRSADKVSPAGLLSGLTAAAVRADMPDLPFHKIYFDLYGFGKPPSPSEDAQVRSASAHKYYNEKFVFNAYLAVKQRDRFARFLKHKLGDQFELIGDHWQEAYDLAHTPRIWNMGVLHDRMRRVPICLNLMKGNNEGGLNVRHFEITATGGFMLTYHSAELSHCFDAGRECAEFRNEDELLQRIGYFLDHPQERREIAAAGQERTLSRHLYSHRINQLVRILANNDCLPTRRDTQRSLKGIKDDQPHVEPIPKIRVRGVTDQDCVVTPIGQSALRS